MNPHEERARAKKASALRAFVFQLYLARGKDALADDSIRQLEGFDLDWWAMAAKAAGVKAPSAATVTDVLELLRGQARMRNEDPFACIEATRHEDRAS